METRYSREFNCKSQNRIKPLILNAVSLPKAAVLSDETETDFWIMKMINSNTAVKIPIKKGIETEDKVEILSPILTAEDKILLTEIMELEIQ